ncbi:PI-PLC X domain-containing protein 1 isoform X2 [Andrena cerasifolii]|uniref:PI-PLC X domain-containing protein 1 isoform X2 n=1 Tax=Andrena cerasifolii TaxID=2819439 RepID=UPI0040376185
MDGCTATLILTFLLMPIDGTFATRVCNTSVENGQSRIGILVSPIISESMTHEIEVYWSNVSFEPSEKILIMKRDSPQSDPVVISTTTPNGPTGIQRTRIKTKFLPSSELSFVPRCVFHIARQTPEGGIKEMDCVRTQPTWMKERQHILGPLRFSQVFLPGTHNSASYARENDAGSIFSDFAVNQNVDIFGQLIHGVRYLDIRVGHYPDTNETWWTNHGPFYRSVSLKTVAEQVKRFLNNTEEIVIMDVREFPVGFSDISTHRKLVSYLENEFRDHLFLRNNRGWRVTLNDVWSSGRRLIIGYEHTRIAEEHASVWPCVQHQWGNVRTIADLYKHLDRIESNDSDYRVRPRSAMAQLTANFMDVISNRLGNLRDMAYSVNANVTNWYSTLWQYSANIVAVDFVKGTGIVETAIKANENRHLRCLY